MVAVCNTTCFALLVVLTNQVSQEDKKKKQNTNWQAVPDREKNEQLMLVCLLCCVVLCLLVCFLRRLVVLLSSISIRELPGPPSHRLSIGTTESIAKTNPHLPHTFFQTFKTVEKTVNLNPM